MPFDYSNHYEVLEALTQSQDADDDNRMAAREAHLFIDKRDGQWEPYWWNINSGKPRYTFDMTGPVVDIIAGDMEIADFDIQIRPAGGDSTKDDAKLLDGLVRNIENISGASDVYNMAGRNMVTSGLDGWIVKQKYVDGDSFDQDLVIEPIANYLDSVWLGPFTKADASDCKWGVILEAIPEKEYEERWPDGSGQSLSQSRNSSAYFHKFDHVIVGNIYYIKKEKRTLLKMTSGKVLDQEEVKDVLDEMAAQGETVVSTREREKDVVYSRLFDGKDWLNEPQKTVFNQIPIISTIGNFKVFEDKILYRGAVEKLIDPQRVFNYSKSREIEEGALAPRAKYFMTKKQASGHERELATMNTNSDPVQFYNADPAAPGPPAQSGGAHINPGLQNISNDMRGIMQSVASLFAASMGDNPGLQSGVAIEKLQDRGNIGINKYFAAQARAIRRTAKILVDAIPYVYNQERQVRILKEDGSFDVTTVNQTIFDLQTMRPVTVNDLSKGKYDVTCKARPSFDSRQAETVAAITEMAGIDISALEMGGDILFNNMSSPGMDLLAQRKRRQLFQAGIIPVEQMTDEEKEEMQQIMSQPPQPDAATILAQAEVGKAEAQSNKVMVDAQMSQRREDREDWKAQQEIMHKQAAFGVDQEKFNLERMIKMQEQQIKQQNQMLAFISTQADTLKTIREAMGIESVVGPDNMQAYINQAISLNRSLQGS